MYDKDISKLNRKELLEMFLSQTKAYESLQEEVKQLSADLEKYKKMAEELREEKNVLTEELDTVNQQLEETTAELKERKINIEKSGSIAEAALKINNMFTAAQQSIDDYVANVEKKYANLDDEIRTKEAESRIRCIQLMNQTKAKCDTETAKNQADCEKHLKMTKDYCEKQLADTKAEADAYWDNLTKKLEEFYDAHEGMRDLMNFFNMKVPGSPAKKNPLGEE